MSNTIYCGSGKKQNDTWLKITINPDKIAEHIQEYKGKHFVKLNVNIKDQPDQYGKAVSVSVDTYRPDEEKDDPPPVEEEPKPDSKLPF